MAKASNKQRAPAVDINPVVVAVGKASGRNSIALEAVSLVYGVRGEDYGPEVSCFNRCATIMNAIKDKTDTNNYTGKQVALLMMSMKLARRQYKHKRDNNVDLVGYTDLLEIFEQEEPLK